MADHHPTRREVLKYGLAGLCAAGAPSSLLAGQAASTASAPASRAAATDAIPRRVLGRTGVEVAILGLGGDHVGFIRDDRQAIRLVRRAIDAGINFLDNAWSYNGGRSEELYGKALTAGYRDKVFLMTKTLGRTKADAMRQLETSLRRLRTDHIDLWQLHAINRPGTAERIFAADGAIEAAVAARKQGKVRFIGFTGHREPQYMLEMLQQDFEWDTAQLPINLLDPHYKSFQQQVLPVLLERRIGLIAMKTLAWGWLLRTGVVSAEQALGYAWSQPISLAVVGMDSAAFLESNIAAARSFQPMGSAEQARLLEATRRFGADGKYEPHKTAQGF